MRHTTSKLLVALVPFLLVPVGAGAQTKTSSDTLTKASDLEHRVQAERRGGGVRVGPWRLNGKQLPSGVSGSTTAQFEGYYRTGFDLHVALENSIGLWRQRQSSSAGGGLLGGGSTATADNYIIPQVTSIVFYPATAPNDRLEPFVRGGVGFALGVQDPQNGGSIAFTPGFGATGGVGLEWHASRALGLALSGRYQWIRFFQDFAGLQTYQGPAVELGITYRFQFR
jgi:opacity protein-like surface antigen